MRPHLLLLLGLAACAGAQSSSKKDEPLGYLVGSWRSVGPSGTRVEIDFHEDGTFAMAYPKDGEDVPCVVTGTASYDGGGYLYFTAGPDSPCGRSGEFSYRFEREDVEQVSYVQDSDFYTDCDVPECTLWTAVRASGPLVPPELIAAAKREVEETLRRWAEEEPEPYVPSDDPDEPAEPAEPDHFAEITALMTVREQLVDETYLTGYSTRIWNTHNPEGQDGPTDYAFTSSWVMYPDLRRGDRDVEYAIVIIVPSSAKDPQGTFYYDDKVVDLVRSTSADGAWYYLGGRLTLTGETGEMELEVHYWAGSSDGSILGLYR